MSTRHSVLVYRCLYILTCEVTATLQRDAPLSAMGCVAPGDKIDGMR